MKTRSNDKTNMSLGTFGWFAVGAVGALGLGYALRTRARAPQLARFAGMGAGPTSGADSARKLEPNWHEGRDGIEEASWESFPASDPPAF